MRTGELRGRTEMTREIKVYYNGGEIRCTLERKRVKNLNLRITRDGSVFVSANPGVPERVIRNFVAEKGAYIFSARRKILEFARKAPPPRSYCSGERFCILGREFLLEVSEGAHSGVFAGGGILRLCVRDAGDLKQKERTLKRFLDKWCRIVFEEILLEKFGAFERYGVSTPSLRVRAMKTRWGSCLSRKGVITLNSQLLEMPRSCVEYVAVHELCHLIHPNHSARFYALLTEIMPDWKTRRADLNSRAAFLRRPAGGA